MREQCKTPTEGCAPSWKGAREIFVQCIDWYLGQGAEVVVLASFDMPVSGKDFGLRTDERFKDQPYVLVDSMSSLVSFVARGIAS